MFGPIRYLMDGIENISWKNVLGTRVVLDS